MSDWIKKDGVKYFRESYLKLANKTAKRRADRIATLEAQLAEVAELPDKIGLEDIVFGEPVESVQLGRLQVADELTAILAKSGVENDE